MAKNTIKIVGTTMEKEVAKQKILEKIQFYNQNKNKFEKILETDTRIKFIDPIFEYLGWDVWGNEIPDEVQREESVKSTESKKKKADYTFRINSITKFILEAKAIKEDLAKESYIEQITGYAYNKACTWGVLTNFEYFVIYYVDREDKTIFYNIHLTDLDKFDDNFETLWLLSKECFIKNKLDIEADKRGLKKKKKRIDHQLSEDLTKWRGLLSDDIKRNYRKEYGDKEFLIDEIVQRIIDRLIFIRKAEDAELEERKLDQLARRFSKNTYKELKEIFVEYNSSYNSKLFGEDAADQHLCDLIEINNDIIETVIAGMYRPEGSKVGYNFDAIDADILGGIYEEYLSFILKKTPKKAKLEGGIAHRKEQGIY